MELQFSCPSCGSRLVLGPELAGREVRCPKCGAASVAPGGGAAPAPVPVTAPSAVRDERPCPYCGEMIHTHAQKCRFCGTWLNAVPGPGGFVPGMAPQQASGLAVASMILGIVALVLVCIWWIAIPCSIVGLILGMVARGKAARGEAGGSGMATAGIVCSMCSLALYLLLLVLGISFLAALSR